MEADRLRLRAAAFESTQVGLVVVDVHGWLANESCVAMLALATHSGPDLSSLGPGAGPDAIRALVDDLLAGSKPEPSVVSFETAHGEQTVLRLTPLTAKVAGGGGDGRLIQTENITAQMRTEAASARLNAELERSNADLLSFATIAAHDLQEPVRKIRAFADRIGPALAGDATLAEADYLVRLQNAAIRMQSLLDDLLTFARVRVDPIDAEPIDLNELLAGVRVAVDDRLEQVGGELAVDPALPVVLGDASRLAILFENLILNSLKFVVPDRPPRVSISSSWSSPEIVRIDVVDNGIGFESDYAEMIFEPFRRLHSRADFAGTGIGLALCRRIVERLGGHIVAIGVPGGGATFSIELLRPPNG